MSSFESESTRRLGMAAALQRVGYRRLALLLVPHLAAAVLLVRTEVNLTAAAAFLLAWGLVNFVLIVLLRRPLLSGILAAVLIGLLTMLSQLKQHVLQMTANFVDVMIIDADTVNFLLTIYPNLRLTVFAAVLAALPVLYLLWRHDPFRMHRLAAGVGGASCLVGLSALSLAVPAEQHEAFYPGGYVSKFARSGVTAVSELISRGILDSDPVTADTLRQPTVCDVHGRKRPHIVMVFDESSFDIRAIPGVKVPPGYGAHFRSFDGKRRSFVVEGAGGPSWYTEYNVLTGLSALSYGQFAYFVTRIAAGRVERGLPNTLRGCGYKTHTFYPAYGAFLSARNFQTSTGIQHFRDAKDLRTRAVEPDSFFYGAALKTLAKERREDPLFLFVYLAANHFPWETRYRPDLTTPNWRDPGNAPNVDEYLRRQAMSARDYAAFLERLKRDFPNDPFLIVRFGDHQPEFAANLVEPGLSDAEIGRRIMAFDERYFTTYYAIDTVNFRPADLSSALDKLEAPYLPLVVLEAAGLTLDPSFAEQKRIMQRCRGQFFRCEEGAAVRRFNRLLINAGLIKDL